LTRHPRHIDAAIRVCEGIFRVLEPQVR